MWTPVCYLYPDTEQMPLHGNWLPMSKCHTIRKWPLITLKSDVHGVVSDQNNRVWEFLRAHKRLDNGLIFVWSEVTFVWVCLFRGRFKGTLVRSEKISSAIGSDQRPSHAPFLIRFFVFFFTERCWLCREATKGKTLLRGSYSVWWLWSEPK